MRTAGGAGNPFGGGGAPGHPSAAQRGGLRRTGIIALALPELGNPYFAEPAGAVIDAAARHDHMVPLDHTAGERRKEILVTRGFRTRVIDGLSPIEPETPDPLAGTDRGWSMPPILPTSWSRVMPDGTRTAAILRPSTGSGRTRSASSATK